MILTVYYIVSVTALPAAYNYWAILSLDIFGLIFWLISMALLAWEVAVFGWAVSVYSGSSSSSYCDLYGYCYKKREMLEKRSTDAYTYRNVLAAAAGLGGLELYVPIPFILLTTINNHSPASYLS